jgi:hypothetical protein
MKKWGLALALVLIAVGAWFDWSYRAMRSEIAELPSRLPSEEALNSMSYEESVEQLNTATAACDRVQSSLIAKWFFVAELKALAERCELIKSRHESLQGP